MTEGYDFEFMIVDYDNDILTIIRGDREYEFPLSTHTSLFEGAKADGVEYQKIGNKEDAEDTDEDEYDKYKQYWDDEMGWVDEYGGQIRRKHTGKSIRGSRW